MGKYIYGILNGSNRQPLVLHEGIHTVLYQDISAVVCDSAIVDYTSLPRNSLARQLVNHQRIIEGIMAQKHTIIPMGLGTFAVDESEVRDILAKGYKLIKRIMERIPDRLEMDVCATWSDFTSVLKEVGEQGEIREARDRLLASQEIGVDDQIRIGYLVNEALKKKRGMCAEKIQGRLGAISEAFSSHELMDEKMVVNTAFLIDSASQGMFDAKINELDEEFNQRLNFRCVGPLPPYSFYTLRIKRIGFEEIDWARKRLGLGDKAGRDEIKRAYQLAAASTHPDMKPGMEKEFDEVARAYRLLGDYLCACEQTGEKEVKGNAILVTVNS